MELSKILKGALTIIAVGLVLLMLWYLRSVVGYIILSAVLAIVGRPLVERLTAIKIGRCGLSRTVAASITLLLMWIVIGGLGMLFIPLVADKVNELLTLDWNGLAESLREPLSKFENSINNFFFTPVIDVIKVIENIAKNFVSDDFIAAFTAEKFVHRSAEDFALYIPECLIYSGNCAHKNSAAAVKSCAVNSFPNSLNLRGIFSY